MDGRHFQIKDNHIYSNTRNRWHRVFVILAHEQAPVSDVQYMGNQVFDTQDTPTQTQAFLFRGDGNALINNVLIMGNYFEDITQMYSRAGTVAVDMREAHNETR